MPIAKLSPTHSEQRAAAASRLADSVLRRAGVAVTPAAARKTTDESFLSKSASPAASSIRGATAQASHRRLVTRSAAGIVGGSTPRGRAGPGTPPAAAAAGSGLHYYCYSPSAAGSSAYREHDVTGESSFGAGHGQHPDRSLPAHDRQRDRQLSEECDAAPQPQPEPVHADPAVATPIPARAPHGLVQRDNAQPSSLLASLARPIAVVRARLERVQRIEAALRADVEREWLEDRLCIFDAMTASRVSALAMATLHSSPMHSSTHSCRSSPPKTPPQQQRSGGIRVDDPSPTALQPLQYNGYHPQPWTSSRPLSTSVKGAECESVQRRQPSPPQGQPPATASVAAASQAHRYCTHATEPSVAGESSSARASTAAVLSWRQGVPATRRLDYERPAPHSTTRSSIGGAENRHHTAQRSHHHSAVGATTAVADSTFTSIAGTETTPERSRMARRPIMAPLPSPAPSKTPKRAAAIATSRQLDGGADEADDDDTSHLLVEDVANLTMESGIVDSDSDGDNGGDRRGVPERSASSSANATAATVVAREYYFCAPIDCDVSADLVLFPRKFSAARPRSGVRIGHQFANGDKLTQADGQPLRQLSDVAQWAAALAGAGSKQRHEGNLPDDVEHWVVVIRGDRRVCVDL